MTQNRILIATYLLVKDYANYQINQALKNVFNKKLDEPLLKGL